MLSLLILSLENEATITLPYDENTDQGYKYTDYEAVLEVCEDVETSSITKTISPSGGLISLGEISMDIPTGAVTKDTSITIQEYELSECYVPGENQMDIKENQAEPQVFFEIVSPSDIDQTLSVTKDELFEVGLRVTCYNADCGDVRVDINYYDEEEKLISSEEGMPFYTGPNPVIIKDLVRDESKEISFLIYATGEIDTIYNLFAEAEVIDYYNSKQTPEFEVKIEKKGAYATESSPNIFPDGGGYEILISSPLSDEVIDSELEFPSSEARIDGEANLDKFVEDIEEIQQRRDSPVKKILDALQGQGERDDISAIWTGLVLIVLIIIVAIILLLLVKRYSKVKGHKRRK